MQLYSQYHLDENYANNLLKSETIFKEDLFYNKNLDEIVKLKLNDFIIDLTNYE